MYMCVCVIEKIYLNIYKVEKKLLKINVVTKYHPHPKMCKTDP